jgi:hypothetical protein
MPLIGTTISQSKRFHIMNLNLSNSQNLNHDQDLQHFYDQKLNPHRQPTQSALSLDWEKLVQGSAGNDCATIVVALKSQNLRTRPTVLSQDSCGHQSERFGRASPLTSRNRRRDTRQARELVRARMSHLRSQTPSSMERECQGRQK